MAVYYFEVKTDKRKGKGQISAAKHERYISREDEFRDIDEKTLAKMATENIITGPKLMEHQPKRELLLYSSPYGIIKQDDSGIKVSRNASKQTIAIALEVAKELYGDNLTIKGQDSFQRKAISAVSSLNLDVTFAKAEQMEAVRKQREEQENERRRFEHNGGIYGIPSNGSGLSTGIDASTGRDGFPFGGGTQLSESDTKLPTISEITKRGWDVPSLSGRNMVFSWRDSSVLLHRNESLELQRRIRRRQDSLPKLRWDVSRDTANAVKMTASDIIHNIQNNLDKTFASSHVQYINRESVFKKRGGCVYTAHHLPKWANDNALNFFKAADRYERKDGERYKEIVFSLPNELNLEQQKEMIDNFLKAHMQNFYYAYAIHDKVGTLGNGERHPHVHLMFSPREIDSYEREHERSPQQFFMRSNSQHPEKGGCKKSDFWNGKNRAKNLMQVREDFARIQNESLAKYGIPVRVDHRSLKARRQEALAQGNTFLAELLNRVPEKAVGPLALLEKDNKQVLAQQRLRAMNKMREKKIVAKTLLMAGMQETKLRHRCEEMRKALIGIREILNDDEKIALSESLQKIEKMQNEADALMAASLWPSEVIEQSMTDFMTQEERELWRECKRQGEELKNWKNFKASLRPEAIEDESLRNELLQSVEREIKNITSDMRITAARLQPVFKRLKQPRKRKEIFRRAGNLLFNSKETKKKLEQLLKAQEKEMAKFGQKYKGLVDSLKDSPSYTASAVVEHLQQTLKDLYAKEHQLRAEMRSAQKKVISPARATAMAQNSYTKGEFKKLRTAERELKKKAATLAPKEFYQKRDELSAKRKQLEEKCAKPEAVAKIEAITAGILRKNLPSSMAYQKLVKEHQHIA